MKFYVTDVNAQIHTFTVNGGEYQQGFKPQGVFLLLCKYLRVDKSILHVAASHYHNPERSVANYGEERVAKALGQLTPNEESQLQLFMDFSKYVESSLETDGRNTESRVLHLCDLNSGAQLTWIHSVC